MNSRRVSGSAISSRRGSKISNGREEPLLPAERVLIKREPDGAETVVAKGVLDYAVTPDGEIVRSDGRYIIMPGGEKVKAHLARNLTVL